MSINELQFYEQTYMKPECFGPGVWLTLHELSMSTMNGAISLNDFKSFVKFLSKELPCKECRSNFSKKISGKGMDGISTNPFIWAWSVHNQVNCDLMHFQPDLQTVTNVYANGNVVADELPLLGGKSPFTNISVGVLWCLKTTKKKNKKLFEMLMRTYPCMPINDEAAKGNILLLVNTFNMCPK